GPPVLAQNANHMRPPHASQIRMFHDRRRLRAQPRLARTRCEQDNCAITPHLEAVRESAAPTPQRAGAPPPQHGSPPLAPPENEGEKSATLGRLPLPRRRCAPEDHTYGALRLP